MIKIIKENRPHPRPYTFQWMCRKCKSVFQFDETDCTESYDRTSRILEINCPVCSYPTWSAESWEIVTEEKPQDTVQEPPAGMYHENGMPIM